MDTSPSSVRVSETQAQTESVMRLVEISAGYWLPRALQVVADLANADALDREPRSAADLAKSVGVDAVALDRVLRLLASHGVFDRRKGKYVHIVRHQRDLEVQNFRKLVGTFLIWRDEIRHPDPAYAVSYGILTVAFALRELILFDQARTFRHALAVGDDDLKTELPRMFLRYLGIETD